ncbi:catalase-related domain-containing protein [Streptomyces flaveolus]
MAGRNGGSGTRRLHPADDDEFSQLSHLVREVMDDAQCDWLVGNVTRHLRKGVPTAVRERAFQYWKNIDATTGSRIADAFA